MPAQPDTWYGLDLTWHPKLRQAVKSVVDWYKRGSGALILAGDTGCGKSTLAKVVYEKFGGPAYVLDWSADTVESVRNAIFYAEPEMFADIRHSYDPAGKKQQSEGEIIKMCQRSHLFIFDDLGVAHIREESLPWAQDIYWRIFDARVSEFTLITTNMKKSQLGPRIGTRALSRLMEAMGSEAGFVDMFGIPDYRQRGWTK